MKTALPSGMLVFVLTGCAMFHSTSAHNKVERAIREQGSAELNRLEEIFDHRLEVVAVTESITYDYDLSTIEYFLRDKKFGQCYVFSVSHHKHYLDFESCSRKPFTEPLSSPGRKVTEDPPI